ncbi:SR1 protein [Neobacillus bataviensis]|uniref:SR1 protein n=1 Tax=Neobacillus bataviensis TaxID=220685 RepID=A0A561CMK0_9BACI|nr:GapA-binding peptide SR1P [Neobacillus bataviensis]TWD92503.1 SR1 protein [Neobacillus bataviensis]
MVVSRDSEVVLGTIICDRCGKFIDTADTNRVIIYYSRCEDDKCSSPEEE